MSVSPFGGAAGPAPTARPALRLRKSRPLPPALPCALSVRILVGATQHLALGADAGVIAAALLPEMPGEAQAAACSTQGCGQRDPSSFSLSEDPAWPGPFVSLARPVHCSAAQQPASAPAGGLEART